MRWFSCKIRPKVPTKNADVTFFVFIPLTFFTKFYNFLQIPCHAAQKKILLDSPKQLVPNFSSFFCSFHFYHFHLAWTIFLNKQPYKKWQKISKAKAAIPWNYPLGSNVCKRDRRTTCTTINISPSNGVSQDNKNINNKIGCNPWE